MLWKVFCSEVRYLFFIKSGATFKKNKPMEFLKDVCFLRSSKYYQIDPFKIIINQTNLACIKLNISFHMRKKMAPRYVNLLELLQLVCKSLLHILP